VNYAGDFAMEEETGNENDRDGSRDNESLSNSSNCTSILIHSSESLSTDNSEKEKQKEKYDLEESEGPDETKGRRKIKTPSINLISPSLDPIPEETPHEPVIMITNTNNLRTSAQLYQQMNSNMNSSEQSSSERSVEVSEYSCGVPLMSSCSSSPSSSIIVPLPPILSSDALPTVCGCSCITSQTSSHGGENNCNCCTCGGLILFSPPPIPEVRRRQSEAGLLPTEKGRLKALAQAVSRQKQRFSKATFLPKARSELGPRVPGEAFQKRKVQTASTSPGGEESHSPRGSSSQNPHLPHARSNSCNASRSSPHGTDEIILPPPTTLHSSFEKLQPTNLLRLKKKDKNKDKEKDKDKTKEKEKTKLKKKNDKKKQDKAVVEAAFTFKELLERDKREREKEREKLSELQVNREPTSRKERRHSCSEAYTASETTDLYQDFPSSTNSINITIKDPDPDNLSLSSPISSSSPSSSSPSSNKPCRLSIHLSQQSLLKHIPPSKLYDCSEEDKEEEEEEIPPNTIVTNLQTSNGLIGKERFNHLLNMFQEKKIESSLPV
jgi:hypothetical protein